MTLATKPKQKGYWHCRVCGFRNVRTASQKCAGCERKTKPKRREPKHRHPLHQPWSWWVAFQERVHGLDEFTCAICGQPGREDVRLQRDHAHHGGGYARGLTHALCNKRLGEVERGQDAELWLEAALAYVRRAREAQSDDRLS